MSHNEKNFMPSNNTVTKKIAIVFFSATGTTHQLAKEIEKGINQTLLAQAVLLPINNNDIVTGRYTNKKVLDSVNYCDALIMGSPTYMGGPAAQFKAFADATSEHWYSQTWKNKLAAGFTVGSNLNGDQLNTINYFSIFAGQHGMIWAGLDRLDGADSMSMNKTKIPFSNAHLKLPNNRLGNQQGLIAQSSDGTLPEEDLHTAYYFGKRIVSLSF